MLIFHCRNSNCNTTQPGARFRWMHQSRSVADRIFRHRDQNVPLNPQLDTLSDYPFEALRTLLNPVTPRVNDTPIIMSVGEPQHQPPALLAETIEAHAHEWNRYPPMQGTPELRQAIVDWLTRRYHLPAGALNADKNILTLAGTKEGLYLFSSLVVPRGEGGGRPIVLVPDPDYLVFNGPATM